MRKPKLQFTAAIAALIMAALACSFSASTANIQEAWTARDEVGVDRTTVFDPGDVFYVLVTLANAPDDTTLKAIWIAVETQVSEPHSIIDVVELTEGSGTHNFSLVSEEPWPLGKFKVDLYLDDELERSLEFEVRDSSASSIDPSPAASVATIANAYLARDEVGGDRTTLFSPNDNFYAFVELTNAPDDTTMKAVWIAVETQVSEPNLIIDEVELTEGSGIHNFSLVSEQPWPPGKFKVDLYLNGEMERTLDFQVEAVGPQDIGAYIVDAYMARDVEGEQQTTFFSSTDIFYAHVELADAPDDTQVKAVWTAVNVEGESPNTFINETAYTSSSGWIYFELSNTEPWPTGTYMLEIYVNDLPHSLLEFEVH